jgi:general secretion pathway protein C
MAALQSEVDDTTHDAELVAERNVFCTDCAPVGLPPPAPPGATLADAPPPLTSLPLELLAITTVSGQRYAFARIAAADARWSGAYYLDDEIPGAGPVVALGGRFVDFHNRSSGRIERLDVLGAPPPSPPPLGGGVTELDTSIKKIDDAHFEVSRALIDKLLADPALLASSARLRPAGGGQPGFKVFAVRADSAAARLGLKNGDTLTAVNGYELGQNYDKLLELYTKLKSSERVSLQVMRGGQTVTLTYAIK